MAIRLITGDTFDSVAEAVYDQIKENGLHTGRHIVFVPDQFALMNEMSVLDYLGLKSSFNIEVVGFSRFAHRLIGGDGKIMLNQQTSVMLLQKIILDHREELVCYKKVAGYKGYVSEIYAVITNLRNSGITPEQLADSTQSMTGYLREKMRDIALLYREYIKLLATEYTDIGSELEILASRIATDENISKAHIYVVDFHDLSKVKLNILAQCIKYCRSFTIGVVDCPNAKNARIYPRYLTEFVREQAKNLDLPVQETQCISRLGQDRSVVADRIFSHYLTTDIESDGTYHIAFAEDIEGEVKGVARQIRQLIVDEGMRYRDIAICVSDLEKYKNHIVKIFRDFDVPYYFDDKTPLMTTAFARALLSAIDVISKRYRRSEVMSFAKCGLLGLKWQEVCIFERFCDKFNINYTRFTSPFEVGKDSYDYATAEKVRQRIVDATSRLKVSKDSVAKYIDNIKDFYQESILPYYADYLAGLEKINHRMYDVATMVVDKVLNILDQIVEILGEGDYTGLDVCNMIRGTFDSVEISTVPQYVDSLFVGEMGKSKYMGVKVVILMGAQDGTYPADSDGKGIIGNDEAKILEGYGIEFFPNYHQKLMLDKFYVEQLLLTASERVIATFNLSEGASSIMVMQLARILNIKPEKLVDDKNIAIQNMLDYALKIGTKSNAQLQLMSYYSERKNGVNTGGASVESVYDYVFGKVGKGELDAYLTAKDLPSYIETHGKALYVDESGKKFSSVSAVEAYFACPFKHFCQKMLKLKPIESGDMNVLERGSFVHRVLELMFCDWQDVLHTLILYDGDSGEFNKKIDGYVYRALGESEFEKFRESFKPGEVEKLLIERCRFIARKVADCAVNSKYNDRELEFSFGGKEDDLPPLEIGDGEHKYYMSGRIDRIDKSPDGKYFVVIDYKSSGSIDFGFKEIYYGNRVQLLLYTKAYMRDHDAQPLAVYYMPLPYKYQKTKDKCDYKYVGITKNVPWAVTDFDLASSPTNAELDQEIYGAKSIPASVTDDGVKGALVVKDKEMSMLLDYAEDVIVQAIGEIEHGYIRPKPIGDCKYCEYANICGVKNVCEHRRKRNNVQLYGETQDQGDLPRGEQGGSVDNE